MHADTSCDTVRAFLELTLWCVDCRSERAFKIKNPLNRWEYSLTFYEPYGVCVQVNAVPFALACVNRSREELHSSVGGVMALVRR